MTTRIVPVGLLAALALTLSACGGTESVADAAQATTTVSEAPMITTPTAPEEEEFQGPATSTATFPGGLDAHLVSVTAGPAEPWVTREDPTQDGWVRVVVELTPWNDETYPLDINGVSGTLLYGVNAQAATMWFADGGVEEMPTQVTPGTTVQVAFDYSMPAAEMDALQFVFTTDSTFEPAYTFTDVQAIAG